MGSWGAGIFQNDVADDVCTDYRNKLKLGKSDEQALKELLDENADYMNDDEDKFDFWFGLSSVLYDFGRLTPEVRDIALRLIDEGESDIARWERAADIKRRRNELEKLKNKLTSEQPPRKKLPPTKPFTCPWQPNDVYVYRPEGFEKYVLLAVEKYIQCDADIKGLNELLPVTFIKLSDIYPKTLDDVNNAVFLPKRILGQGGPVEYRRMWFKNGFKKAAARFEFAGSFIFERPSLIEYDRDEGLYYCESWSRLDIAISDGIRMLSKSKEGK